MTPVSNPAGTPAGSRPRRADARRNRDALLAAAREVFAAQGVGAPLDDVARRAGVGNATMYRHFPTRHELIVAVYADEVAALCEHGAALARDAEPGEALFAWLSAFIAHVMDKRDLAAALSGEPDGRPLELYDAWHAAMHSTMDTLLRRAVETGAVRADVDAWDLLTLANGIALAGSDAARTGRMLAVLRAGMAAERPDR